jgi:hypothetical protein
MRLAGGLRLRAAWYDSALAGAGIRITMEGLIPRRTVLMTVSTALSGLLYIWPSAAWPQSGPPDDHARLKDAQALTAVVYATLRGRVVPSERPFRWSNDFFKGEHGNTYVPYTVTIERAKLPTSTVAMYVFVTPHPQAARKPAGKPAVPETEEPQAPPAPETAFEKISFVDLSADRGQGAYRISRTFSLSAGNYDVYVALSPVAGSGTSPQGNPAAPMMIKQELSVPDLWTTGLATSTVVVADRVDVLAAPLTAEQQDLEPYTLGARRIVPAQDTNFKKSDELGVIFFVYNHGLTARGKPDISVEYRFHKRDAGGETYFTRTAPQQFNAQTLPTFDAAAGHQLVAGQAVPLKTFPEGAYRLEITITDKTKGSTLTRNVDFGVR